MSPTRRHFLRSATLTGVAAAGPLLGSASYRAAAEESSVPSTGAHVVLLGTAAGPVPMAGRKGICTAFVVDGHTYLIDVGRGAVDQFETARLTMDTLEGIFVTHLHSDHLADLYTLLWLRFGGFNSMTHPVDVYGPGPAGALPEPSSDRDVDTINRKNPTPGLVDFFAKSMEATAYDLNIRMRDEAWPDIRTLVRPHEIQLPEVDAGPLGDMAPPMEPFEVMADDRVRVSAILVQHPPVFPSFAFRFDTDYGSVVFSGDTTVTPNMVTLARGADMLVHEVIDLQAVETFGNLTPEQLQHHRNSHTEVTKVGPIAQEAGVATLVLNHLAPSTPAWSDVIWLGKAQQGFTGKVIVGDDLMRIPL